MPGITFNVSEELKDDFDDKIYRENKKARDNNKEKVTKSSVLENFVKEFTYGRKTK